MSLSPLSIASDGYLAGYAVAPIEVAARGYLLTLVSAPKPKHNRTYRIGRRVDRQWLARRDQLMREDKEIMDLIVLTLTCGLPE